MQEQKVNIAEFVPVVFRSFIDYLEKTGRTLDFMRVIIVGSDSWYVNEFRHAQTLCGPKTRLVNSYGVTEATIDSTWFEGSTAGLPDGYQVPIGRPFANVEIYILDHYLQLVPASVTGEMWIGGDGLARGYLNHDELTAERFIMHPFNPDPHARLYKTGDLARFMLDGNIELIGRADFQVKVRGFRVETGEIEAVLTSRDDVSTCVVTLRENKLGEKRLVAYFVAAIGAEPSPADLRKTVATALPDYMVPSAYVQLDSLPLTPNGKIDRNALPAPEGERQLSDAYVVPSTDTEIAIAEIWQEVLQVKQAGIHDNFFDLGGHSLLAIEVVSKMQERFPADLTLGKFFQLATIAALASYIDSKTRDNQTGDEDRIEIEI
jgi:acyl-coenzyme A synthetase/AMP-(fatty) acid ligase/acyl carrier protein